MIRGALATFLIIASLLSSAAELRGTVVGVADGDTITVLDADKKQHKIRLAGIDAPEKHQGFAEQSKQHLSRLAFKKQATLDCYKTDQYKRKGDLKRNIHVLLLAGVTWRYNPPPSP